MASRRTPSTADLLLTLASRIPWWSDVLLAACTQVFFGLLGAYLSQKGVVTVPTNAAATHSPVPATAAVNTLLAHPWVPAAAIFVKAFHYLLPVFFLISGLVSFFKPHGLKKRD